MNLWIRLYTQELPKQYRGEPRLRAQLLRKKDLRELHDIVIDIQNGFDVRKRYGIRPRRGAPPNPLTRELHFWVACWYQSMRAEKPDALAKTLRGIISQKTGLSDSHLRDILREQINIFSSDRLLTVATTHKEGTPEQMVCGLIARINQRK